MVLFYLSIPFMVLGLVIALGPLVFALVRDYRAATTATTTAPLEPSGIEASPPATVLPAAPAGDAAPERPLVNA